MKAQGERGFIALVTAIIIAVVLVSVVIASCTGSFYARMDALGREQSEEARALAASCVNVALLALATSSDPLAFTIANQSVMIDSANDQSCVVDSLSSMNGKVIIRTHASVSNAYRSVEAAVSLPPSSSILSWAEQ